MKQKNIDSRRAFEVVQGGKNSGGSNQLALSRLIERAGTIAHQWSNGEIGPKGQLRLVEAFRERMPGLPDEVIQISGPAILQAIVDRAGEGGGDHEVIAFLAHVLATPRSPRAKAEGEGFEGEVQRVRAELALISENWGLHVDSDGGYIDVLGEPRMPAGGQEGEGGELHPVYLPHHRIARIHLHGPETEQITNAKFIAMAPRRVEWLIDLITRLMAALPNRGGKNGCDPAG
ncbi:hypothetical protein [Geomonas agri]|uniref:hypothetical protein n=1 Tax=Geomonas agri TaxID=2873702 RepID=UPI001CD4D6B7|nr:hypothetical protein [Geomonas agri]